MKKLVRVIGMVLCAAAGVGLASAVLGFSRIGSCGNVGDQICPAGVGTDVIKIVGSAMALALGAVMTLGSGVLIACLTAAVTLIVESDGTIPKVIGVGLIVLAAVIFLLAVVSKRAAIARATRAAEMAGPDPLGTTDFAPAPTPQLGFIDATPADLIPPPASFLLEARLVTSLERLAALRQNGSLSDDEYTLAKQRLLGGE